MIYVVMDQVLKISDKNVGKIVEGLSLAYFEGNMSEEYQAEAIDAFNNGQTQFSIQDDDSIMIYFYQDTLTLMVHIQSEPLKEIQVRKLQVIL